MLEPVFPFLNSGWRKVREVTNDGFRLGTRRKWCATLFAKQGGFRNVYSQYRKKKKKGKERKSKHIEPDSMKRMKAQQLLGKIKEGGN